MAAKAFQAKGRRSVARPLALAMAAYALIFSLWSLSLHAHLETGIFDLGIHTQALWLLSQRLPDFLTTRGTTILSDHFLPILHLLTPFHEPSALLIFQSLALASGAYPMYRLALSDLGQPRAALGFALAYLLQPGLWSANLFDFHTSTLASPLLLWALWGLHGGNLWLYLGGLGLSLGLGEALGVSVALVGLEAWRLGRRRLALATLGLGVAGAGLAVTMMRAANHGQPSQYQSLYSHIQIAPLAWATYGVLLLLPLGGLPLLGWPRLIPAIPVVVGNLLSWREGQRGLDHHYLATILPFLLWAAVAGWRRLRLDGRALLALAVLSMGLHFTQLRRALEPLPDLNPLQSIPAMASVSADNGPGAHLSQRRELYLFPNPFQSPPLCWGNRPESLVETVGQAGHPPLPGELRRRLQQCAIDSIALSSGDSWPLRSGDKAYWLQELNRSGLYRPQPGGVWRRIRPGALKVPLAEPHPRLSRDGRSWVYEDSRGVIRVRDDRESVIAPGSQPDISADGQQVVFVSESDALVAGDHNASADCFLWEPGGLRRLAPASSAVGASTPHWPRFQPDGPLICLGYGRDRRPQPGAPEGLWLGPVSGDWGTVVGANGELHCRNRKTGRDFLGCTPAQAGHHLVFARQLDGRYQLFDGEKQLTQTESDCLEPTLSEDGHWLVYTAFDSQGRCQVRRRDLVSGSETTLGEGYNPAISGDGHQIRWVLGDRILHWP